MLYITEYNVTDVVDGYLTCALWSSNAYARILDDGSVVEDAESDANFLDLNIGIDDVSGELRAAAVEDVRAFLEANQEDALAFVKAQAGTPRGDDDYWGSLGHDLWLTRNGHGAGFWDRGLGELGERLTKAAKTYGEVDLFLGADGQVHS